MSTSFDSLHQFWKSPAAKLSSVYHCQDNYFLLYLSKYMCNFLWKIRWRTNFIFFYQFRTIKWHWKLFSKNKKTTNFAETLSKAVIDLVGGTGFSILSGVEIIYYYVLKLFMSLRIPRAKRASAKNKILMSFSWRCPVQSSRTFDVLSVIEWHVESTHKNKYQFSSS